MTAALDAGSDPALDPSEPSWGALARVVRETRFVHTWRRLDFMKYRWSVPVDDYWIGASPLVASHRLRPFLEAIVVGPNNQPGFREFVARFDTTDLNFNSVRVPRVFQFQLEPPAKTSYHSFTMFLSDWVARDLAGVLIDNRKAQSPDYARKLLSVSPNSPYAMGLLVEDDWEGSQKDLDRWLGKVGDHPIFLASMARHYEKAGQTDELEATLKRYIAISDDHWAYEMKAGVSKKRGDMAQWKADLDAYVTNAEDYSLHHAEVQVEIANWLMGQGKFGEAKPYTDAAARTGAGWAMQASQRCARGLNDWETAEKLAYQLAERYPDTSGLAWLEFCVASGHGDIESARKWTASALDALPDQSRPGVLIQRGYMMILAGEPAKAIGPLREYVKAVGTKESDARWGNLSIALAATLSDNRALYDAVIDEYAGKNAQDSPKMSATLSLIHRIGMKSPTAAEVEGLKALLETYPVAERGGSAFLIATYLSGREQDEKAKPFWLEAASCPRTAALWKTIARRAVRENYHEAVDDEPKQ